MTEQEKFDLIAYRKSVRGQIRKTNQKANPELYMMLQTLREMLDTMIEGGKLNPKVVKRHLELIAKRRKAIM